MIVHLQVDLFGFTGSTSQKYFDDSRALAKQKELLVRWKQEIFEANEEKNKYYHGKSLPSRRLLSSDRLTSAVSEESGATPVSDWDDESDEGWADWGEVQEVQGVRSLQRRHKKKSPPPPPPPKKKKKPKVEESNTIPESVANGLITGYLVDLDFERKCQQDLVNKGIVTNYGIDIDMSFIEAEHKKIQDSLANRLDKAEAEIEAEPVPLGDS